MEEYIMKLNKARRIDLSKLRTGNNKLPVIVGRYNGVIREERYCGKCNSRQVGDEYHILLQCQNDIIVQLRNEYIPKYYTRNPNIFKFILLMQCQSVKVLNNLSQFCKQALKVFR